VDLLETLSVDVGVRTTGSAAATAAAGAIADAYRELGLDPRFQEFPLLGYDAEEPQLEIDGERWPAGPCVYAHPTPEEGVEGRVRRIGDQPRGLTAGDRASVFAVEDDGGRELGRIYANPVVGGAIPFVSLQHLPITVGPTVYISVEDGDRLTAMEGSRARLVVGGRFVPGRVDRNVLAELPGDGDETVVVSAHFDSVWHGPGTIDNASGVEGVRRVAQRLVGRRHPRTVLFVAFATEEPGLVGSRYFVQEAKLRGELDRVVGVVNLDCIAHGESLMLMVGPDELRGRALEQVRRLGLDRRYKLVVMEREPGTDHYWFGQENIPAVSILHFPYPEYHLPTEHLELVDEQKLEDAVELAVSLVESQLTRPVPRG
jgi:hypothetical protein